MSESTFKDLIDDLDNIRKWEITTEADNRILILIEDILKRLILLDIEK